LLCYFVILFLYTIIFVGDWDNGKKWGHGIFRYSSGAIYDGEWFDNMKVNC